MMKYFFAFFFLLSCFGANSQDSRMVSITPEIFEPALNNPMKGFRPRLQTALEGEHPYSMIVHEYIKWNEIEQNEDDGIQKIIDVCNEKWEGAPDKNVKIIPRVYLDWDGKIGNEYWPDDMEAGDYTSDQFKKRLARLVKRLGKVWDNDPRIAWVQMGIIGYWGEHHHPMPNLEEQEFIGDLFAESFKNKKVLVRRPFQHFKDYPFGWYWDSFAHWDQVKRQAEVMMTNFSDRWKVAPIEGETAYNWGNWEIQPGLNPNETLKDSEHRDFLISYIRKLHCTALGWVSNFDYNDPEVLAGAEEVQKAFGYRYILKDVTYPAEIDASQDFTVSFKVENVGSAPFYYNWPVELRLLDAETHETKWKQKFDEVDIRTWMPGEDWSDEEKAYQIKPKIVNNTGTFQVDESFEKGKYIVALAILDPGGMVPSVRFASKQYFNGGIHPVGYVGIDATNKNPKLQDIDFDYPTEDTSLYYHVEY